MGAMIDGRECEYAYPCGYRVDFPREVEEGVAVYNIVIRYERQNAARNVLRIEERAHEMAQDALLTTGQLADEIKVNWWGWVRADKLALSGYDIGEEP